MDHSRGFDLPGGGEIFGPWIKIIVNCFSRGEKIFFLFFFYFIGKRERDCKLEIVVERGMWKFLRLIDGILAVF